MGHTQKNIKHIFIAVLLIKLHVLNKFSKKVVLYRGKNAIYRFIEAILKSMSIAER